MAQPDYGDTSWMKDEPECSECGHFRTWHYRAPGVPLSRGKCAICECPVYVEPEDSRDDE